MRPESEPPQIRGMFVMGGVLTDDTPKTMPSIPNVLNRFSRYQYHEITALCHSYPRFFHANDVPFISTARRLTSYITRSALVQSSE
jgi:hypothetical protein